MHSRQKCVNFRKKTHSRQKCVNFRTNPQSGMVKLGACVEFQGVLDHFEENYPRVITLVFWGSEKVGRSER